MGPTSSLSALSRGLLQEETLLDDIIDRLLEARNGRPGKVVALSESEVHRGCSGREWAAGREPPVGCRLRGLAHLTPRP